LATLYLSEQYGIVKREGEALRVEIPDDKATGRERKVVRVPLIKVDQVVVQGEVTLPASAIAALLERRVTTHYLTRTGRSLGSLVPDPTRNAALRIAQYEAFCRPATRFNLARACIDGKLRNLRTMLLRFNRSREDAPLDGAIRSIREAQQRLAAQQAPETVAPADRMNGSGAIFAAEGQGSGAYWSVFGKLLGHGWTWTGRQRRPPPDPVNALLSFGYTILINQALAQLAVVGLDPYIGFLHRPGFGKPALALDLVEEFRPLVVDSTVLTLLNTGVLRERDFVREAGNVRLTDDGRRTFLTKLEERLNSDIVHPEFGYRASYRRCIELQARLLGKALMGEIPAYPPFIVR
jgi:CRISPR-associated protein Cas1